ncbi:MAG: hypothetical protein ACK54F_06880 [Planctomycetia bacterium]
MFSNPRDPRAARLAPAYGLAIVILIVVASPVAASEIMAAVPSKSAPPALIKPPARERQSGGGCQNGHCAAGKQHHRHADRCEGRCANGNCGKPGCPAQCPVRPDRFGFYGTQWRVWPGQGVVQASFTDAATPVRPPKSEIPDVAEESPRSAPELLTEQESGEEESGEEESREEESRQERPAAEPLPPAKAPAPPAQQPAQQQGSEPLESPFADEPAAEPDVKKPADKKPALEKPAAPAAEENLFDEASHRRRRHELLASLQQSAMRSELARQEALRQHARQIQPNAIKGVPPSGEMTPPSAVRTVAHEEPVTPSEPTPRVNPLR